MATGALRIMAIAIGEGALVSRRPDQFVIELHRSLTSICPWNVASSGGGSTNSNFSTRS